MFPTAISLETYACQQAKLLGHHISTISLEIGYLPHASEQLNKPTISESKTDDDVGCSDSSSADIDERQHKGRQGESAQSQRSRVGELPLCYRSIGTRLEFTSKGRETRLGRVDVGKRSVPKAGSSFGSFMLLMGHLASNSIALDCVVVLFVMLRIGGHCGGCVDGFAWVLSGRTALGWESRLLERRSNGYFYISSWEVWSLCGNEHTATRWKRIPRRRKIDVSA